VGRVVDEQAILGTRGHPPDLVEAERDPGVVTVEVRVASAARHQV